MSASHSTDLTRSPDLLKEHVTGPVRVFRPVYRNHMPPCNHACPTGEDIQAWLDLAQAGRYRDAWRELVKNNPFPAVSGRICYHNCETACNRAQLDSAVSIHAVERFLGDKALEEGWQFAAPEVRHGRRIMVVGAGPCGLAAACHLATRGHEVEIFEAGPLAGGMMHFGIPAYRLPRDVLEAEVKRIEALGVKIHLNHTVTDLLAQQREGRFDAVLLAIGASLGKRIDIPGCDGGKIIDAISYLNTVARDNPVKLGRRVAIYGGGNTAMDAARTARRMGAEETLIIYRRDRAHMPAHDSGAFEGVLKLEDAGAAAVVLPSLFEEQILREQAALDYYTAMEAHVSAETSSYFVESRHYNDISERYLKLIGDCSERVDMPIRPCSSFCPVEG